MSVLDIDFQKKPEDVILKYSPSKFMRTITPKLDSYTLKSFNFNLQVLATQYKAEEAQKVFDQMKIVGVSPNEESYNHLITVYAKTKNINKVDSLIAQGNLYFDFII